MSLLSGWLPTALRIAALVAVVVAVEPAGTGAGGRVRVPVALVAAVAVAVVVSIVVDNALAAAGAAARRGVVLGRCAWCSRWSRWPGGGRCGGGLVAAGAVVLAAASAASTVNEFVGYYPTVGAAFGELTGQPVPAQVGAGQLSSVDPKTRARAGRAVSTFPDTYSHFTHREEFVYLPPAWFRSGRKEQFPVIEMIGAEFSTPQNWIRAGDAVGDRRRVRAPPRRPRADPRLRRRVRRVHRRHRVRRRPARQLRGPPRQGRPGLHGRALRCRADGLGRRGLVDGRHVRGRPDRRASRTCSRHFLDISGDLGPNIGDQATTIMPRCTAATGPRGPRTTR